VIDLHNHILPGVDDGARTVEESCAMARALLALSVTTVCATPHVNEWSTAPDVGRLVAELQETLEAEGIELPLLAGAEVRLTPRPVPARLNATPYLLLEFPYDSLPPSYEQVIFELQVHGFRPVIAHPERITPIAEDPNILYQLVRRGCLGQLTALSLAGGFGARLREISELMLEHNLIHVIASDAHDCGDRLQAISEAQALCGDRAVELFEETPRKILAGELLKPAPPIEIKKRRFLGVFG